MSIGLSQLRVFEAVAKSGSLKDAAAQLGRTISAVSMTLKQLEAEVGAKLFEADRKKRLGEAAAQPHRVRYKKLAQ